MKDKGDITRQFTVWCGTCVHWDQISSGNLKGFKTDIIALGWRKTPKSGWVCPKCVKKAFEASS